MSSHQIVGRSSRKSFPGKSAENTYALKCDEKIHQKKEILAADILSKTVSCLFYGCRLYIVWINEIFNSEFLLMINPPKLPQAPKPRLRQGHSVKIQVQKL